ncbi:MAG: DNA mismatch repair protein MutH [Legionellaceae bacterium]
MKILPPCSEKELLERAKSIAGLTIGELAKKQVKTIPETLHRDKGWIGQLLETILGATAGSRAEPDFQQLGIELKTIPIDKDGKPRESTYVCTVSMMQMYEQSWHTSNVYKKLARVLWIPIESDTSIPIANRIIGNPLLWSPEASIEKILRQDWEEFAEIISLGQITHINARQGIYLQIRPKAAHSHILCEAIGLNGKKILTLPKGFYLRTLFTQKILQTHYW